jgi:hypothetical protein
VHSGEADTQGMDEANGGTPSEERDIGSGGSPHPHRPHRPSVSLAVLAAKRGAARLEAYDGTGLQDDTKHQKQWAAFDAFHLSSLGVQVVRGERGSCGIATFR